MRTINGIKHNIKIIILYKEDLLQDQKTKDNDKAKSLHIHQAPTTS